MILKDVQNSRVSFNVRYWETVSEIPEHSEFCMYGVFPLSHETEEVEHVTFTASLRHDTCAQDATAEEQHVPGSFFDGSEIARF